MNVSLLINIDVGDLPRAVEFYGAAFGLRPGRRFGSEGAEMLGASSVIYLLVKPPGSSPSLATSQLRGYERHWTPVHLDMVVDDLDAAVAKARLAGARQEGVAQTRNWGRIAYLADPFGNGFCLLQFLGRGLRRDCRSACRRNCGFGLRAGSRDWSGGRQAASIFPTWRVAFSDIWDCRMAIHLDYALVVMSNIANTIDAARVTPVRRRFAIDTIDASAYRIHPVLLVAR